MDQALPLFLSHFKWYVKKWNVYKPWDYKRRILFFLTNSINKRVDKILGYVKVQTSLYQKEKNQDKI